MLYIAERKKFEGKSEQEIMNLFRFLGLKHRITHPTSGNKYYVDPDIKRQLDRAVCDASIRFFLDKKREFVKEGKPKPRFLVD